MPPEEKSHARLWLFLILAGSFALRLWLASIELHAGRFWDERFNMANVAAVLRGSLRPANGWYQGLSYLPQALLLAGSRKAQELTGWEALAVTGPGGFTPSAYFLCRFLQAVYGTLSLLATYVLGRKLFPEAVAVLGTFLLAVTPRHLHASVIFKPDVLLLLWTVVAFVWILEALERPELRRYLLAGVGVGLCMATKLNGGLVAVPFALGTAPLLGKVRRVWLWLVLAGVAAASVFLLFNPFLGMQAGYLGKNLEHYESHATATRLEAFLETLAFPFSEPFHGWLIGLAAVLGGGWMAASAFRKGAKDARGLREIVFLSYPVFYFALYAVATTRAKQNHFLQVLPFTSLLAASFLLAALSWLAGRMGRPVVRRAILAALAGWLAVEAAASVYAQAVPENRARAGLFLRREMDAPRRGRLTYTEAEVSPDLPGKAFLAAGGIRTVDGLETIPSQALDRADAEVFPLSKAGSAFYRKRIAAAGPVLRFRSHPFLGRGEGVGVLFHPWAFAGSREGTARLLRGERWFAGALPLEADSGTLISLGLWLPRGRAGGSAELVAAGEKLPLVRLEGKPRLALYLSPRFTPPSAPGEVVLRIPAEGRRPRRKISFTVYRWSARQEGAHRGEAGVVR